MLKQKLLVVERLARRECCDSFDNELGVLNTEMGEIMLDVSLGPIDAVRLVGASISSLAGLLPDGADEGPEMAGHSGTCTTRKRKTKRDETDMNLMNNNRGLGAEEELHAAAGAIRCAALLETRPFA